MGAQHRFRLSIMGSLTPSDIDDLPLETDETLQPESGNDASDNVVTTATKPVHLLFCVGEAAPAIAVSSSLP